MADLCYNFYSITKERKLKIFYHNKNQWLYTPFLYMTYDKGKFKDVVVRGQCSRRHSFVLVCYSILPKLFYLNIQVIIYLIKCGIICGFPQIFFLLVHLYDTQHTKYYKCMHGYILNTLWKLYLKNKFLLWECDQILGGKTYWIFMLDAFWFVKQSVSFIL